MIQTLEFLIVWGGFNYTDVPRLQLTLQSICVEMIHRLCIDRQFIFNDVQNEMTILIIQSRDLKKEEKKTCCGSSNVRIWFYFQLKRVITSKWFEGGQGGEDAILLVSKKTKIRPSLLNLPSLSWSQTPSYPDPVPKLVYFFFFLAFKHFYFKWHGFISFYGTSGRGNSRPTEWLMWHNWAN